MKRFTPALMALLFTTLPLCAQFEGEFEMKTSITDESGASRGGGTSKVQVSKAGTRTEINMQMEQMNMKMVTLVKTEAPDFVYQISDADKTYTEMNVANMKAMAAKYQQKDQDKWSVQKLSTEKILGYNTDHVLVTHKDTKMELWNSKDFLDLDTFSKMQTQRGQMNDGMYKALKDAGVAGMPLKMVIDNGASGKVMMEVVKADKKSVPASTFEIPAGYTKSAGGMFNGMSGPKIDEAKKQMEEALKNMTPEQRAQFEKMMRQRSGGNQ